MQRSGRRAKLQIVRVIGTRILTRSLIINSDRGLYCPQGDFYVDPWKSVDRALITHAHSDHARSGSKAYLAARDGIQVLRSRLGPRASIQSVAYGEQLNVNGVSISFHSAGHVLGSAQVRLEHRGQVWVVSGDYKTREDPTCAAFELVKCHCFITESTFGLPVFRWPEPHMVQDEINNWWARNIKDGRTSVVYSYSLGKAQRLLAMADHQLGPIFVHSAIHKINAAYLASGIKLPDHLCLDDCTHADFSGALLIAPPAFSESAAFRELDRVSTAFASGWMQIRRNRRSQLIDRGFILSDHADWNELLSVIAETRAEKIIVTHGYEKPLVRYLNENGFKARAFRTSFPKDEDDSGMPADDEDGLQKELVQETGTVV